MQKSFTAEDVDMDKQHLVIVAPEPFWDSLCEGLSPLYSQVEYLRRLAPQPSQKDPYNLTEITHSLSSSHDSILLVAPRRRSPSRLIPSPVLNAVPIGIVQADLPIQLGPWLHALSAAQTTQNATWAVLAMWKDIYLTWGRYCAHVMKKGASNGKISVQQWFADMVSREDLCRRLAEGPQVVVYIGHGRARGWSGYRGVRWKHIEAAELRKPCAVLISFACDTLKRKRGIFPFGCQWVSEGRACSYVGSVNNVSYEDNAAYGYQLTLTVAKGHCQTIGQLLQETWTHLAQDADMTKAMRAFLSYRLIGNPLQTFY